MKAFRIALSALAFATLVLAGASVPATAGEGNDLLSAHRGQSDDRYTTARGR
jgi:hypothetical protein